MGGEAGAALGVKEGEDGVVAAAVVVVVVGEAVAGEEDSEEGEAEVLGSPMLHARCGWRRSCAILNLMVISSTIPSGANRTSRNGYSYGRIKVGICEGNCKTPGHSLWSLHLLSRLGIHRNPPINSSTLQSVNSADLIVLVVRFKTRTHRSLSLYA